MNNTSQIIQVADILQIITLLQIPTASNNHIVMDLNNVMLTLKDN